MKTVFKPYLSQQSIYDHILAHVDAQQAGTAVGQLLLLVHGGAGSGKSALVAALFDSVGTNHGPLLAFKGAATDHAAAIIGGVPLTSIPPSSTMDCGQTYFFIDVANAIDISVLTGLSTQLNNIHNTPSSVFGGKHVVMFADFFQTPPFRNRYNAIWGPHDGDDLITQPFLNNILWLEPEPLAAHAHTPFLDRIRLLAFGGDDLKSLNDRVLNPPAFIAAHAHSNIVIVTPSADRCKLLNYGLPFRAAECLKTTLYVSNATDHISFSVGATIAMTEITQLKESVAHSGEVAGRIPVYIAGCTRNR
ncbi:hypothetical protein F5879DRAFT_923577 [Lentinula edodes]|nr:hypothetical protein F5879DRAFT_923577 [Lentinula edodes]